MPHVCTPIECVCLGGGGGGIESFKGSLCECKLARDLD